MRVLLGLGLLVGSFLPACVFVTDDDLATPAYETCIGSNECEAATQGCFQIGYDDGVVRSFSNICTSSCRSDLDCPYGGACYEVLQGGPATPLCYQRCVSSSECPLGFDCLDTIGGSVFDAICLPR